MEKEFEQGAEQTAKGDLADELSFECEQCKIIQEEMDMFFEANGLTYTRPEE